MKLVVEMLTNEMTVENANSLNYFQKNANRSNSFGQNVNRLKGISQNIFG
jgi:hypothetical protein